MYYVLLWYLDKYLRIILTAVTCGFFSSFKKKHTLGMGNNMSGLVLVLRYNKMPPTDD